MKLSEAKILSAQHKNTAKTIHVVSDGSVYLNADVEALEAHAKEHSLELFHIKPEKEETKKPKAK